jgi:hypothetical protein
VSNTVTVPEILVGLGVEGVVVLCLMMFFVLRGNSGSRPGVKRGRK